MAQSYGPEAGQLLILMLMLVAPLTSFVTRGMGGKMPSLRSFWTVWTSMRILCMEAATALQGRPCAGWAPLAVSWRM